MDEQEYYFAPRPKLSRGARVIRTGAFLTALGISLSFLLADFIDMAGVKPVFSSAPSPTVISTLEQMIRIAREQVIRIAGLTVIQMLMLIPCWRCWMLRRWGCVCVFIMGWTFAFLLRDVVVPVAFAVWYHYSLRKEWPNLKSGF